jgi:hypothetical protein
MDKKAPAGDPPAPQLKHMDTSQGNVNFSGVLKAGIILVVLAVVVHVLMYFLFAFLNKYETKLDRKPSPMFQKDQKPPEPTLQISPAQDLQQFRNNEKETLNAYGWVNQEKGIVHIPISEAIKRVVEKENNAAQ